MNKEELELHFLKLLHKFVEIKLERRQTRAAAPDAPSGPPAPVPNPVSPYAPMLRLLNGEDEAFLVRQGSPEAAERIRRDHRRCFVGYMTLLARDARALRRQRIQSMQSNEIRNFDAILTNAIRIEMALLQMRWLVWKHRLRLAVSAEDVAARLDVILAGWRSVQAFA